MTNCDVALGYTDPNYIVNPFYTLRENLERFTVFYGKP